MSAIEKTNATPLYLQLKNKIKKGIRFGKLEVVNESVDIESTI